MVPPPLIAGPGFPLDLAVGGSARLLGRGEVLTTAAIQEPKDHRQKGSYATEGSRRVTVSARYGVPQLFDELKLAIRRHSNYW